MSEYFSVNVRVQWVDTDAAGIVWFGNFLRFFEQAEDELFRMLGRTRVDVGRDLGILMPRVEASCRFRAPARAEQMLAVGIRVADVTARRIRYAFEVRDRETDQLLCDGGYRVACVAADTFKAIDVPAALHDLLARAHALSPTPAV